MQVSLLDKRRLFFFFFLQCLISTESHFFVQVLASLSEPTQTDRGKVLPPEQEHDYAAHHEVVPSAWGGWKHKF